MIPLGQVRPSQIYSPQIYQLCINWHDGFPSFYLSPSLLHFSPSFHSSSLPPSLFYLLPFSHFFLPSFSLLGLSLTFPFSLPSTFMLSHLLAFLLSCLLSDTFIILFSCHLPQGISQHGWAYHLCFISGEMAAGDWNQLTLEWMREWEKSKKTRPPHSIFCIWDKSFGSFRINGSNWKVFPMHFSSPETPTSDTPCQSTSQPTMTLLHWRNLEII